MTNPTSDLARVIEDLHEVATQRFDRGDFVATSFIRSGIDALTTVAAGLNASIQMHEQARALLDQTLTDRDRALAKLSDAEEDLGREIRNHEITKSELDKAWTKIHFADHGPYCSSRIAVPEGPRYPCDCWKSRP